MSKVFAEYRFFRVVESDAGYRIENKKSGGTIGYIEWYPSWRQWIFGTYPQAAWSDGCLADVRNALARIRRACPEGQKPIRGPSLLGQEGAKEKRGA